MRLAVEMATAVVATAMMTATAATAVTMTCHLKTVRMGRVLSGGSTRCARVFSVPALRAKANAKV